MKITTVSYLFFTLLFFCTALLPQAVLACDDTFYDLPAAGYNGFDFYEPDYYRDHGYDNWFHRTFLNRDTRYSTLRFVDDGYNDCSSDLAPPYNRPTYSFDACGNPIAGQNYPSSYNSYISDYNGRFSRDFWNQYYGSGSLYRTVDPNGYLLPDGTYPICPSGNPPPIGLDRFDTNGFDATYHDGTVEKTIRCTTYEVAESYYPAATIPGDNSFICRPR